MKYITYLTEKEYLISKIKKEKLKVLNPKTNRMKTKRITKYFPTKIEPKNRNFKNLPRYSNKKPKCRFQDWLLIKSLKRNSNHDTCSIGKSEADGKYYGWSHRAVYGFGIGDVIKPGNMGNKYQYSDKIQKKYNDMLNTVDVDYDKVDKWLNSITFEPYIIKTEQEAKEHAIRFAKSVS